MYTSGEFVVFSTDGFFFSSFIILLLQWIFEIFPRRIDFKNIYFNVHVFLSFFRLKSVFVLILSQHFIPCGLWILGLFLWILYILIIHSTVCTLGWVNFSEFEISLFQCVVAAKCKKDKLPIFYFKFFFCFAKILNHFSTPLQSKKKNKLHFRKYLKTVLN